jgi:hypothetical protein
VTTEQELKLAVAVVVVVVVVATGGALVVGAALDDVVGDVEEDELHAARRMVAGPAATTPTMPRRSFGCSLIRPLERTRGSRVRRSVQIGVRLCQAIRGLVRRDDGSRGVLDLD